MESILKSDSLSQISGIDWIDGEKGGEGGDPEGSLMQEYSAHKPFPPEGPDWDLFSFWKPEPVPPKNSKILAVKLHSLGKLKEVTERLFEVPHMARVPAGPWEKERPTSIRLRWQVEDGVILQVKTEQGPPKPGEVLTIRAANRTPNRVFFRLYVQLFEQFGVTVLNEKQHDFMTPREFRALLT